MGPLVYETWAHLLCVCVTDAPFNAVGATFKSVKPCQLSVIQWFTEAAGYANRVGLNI